MTIGIQTNSRRIDEHAHGELWFLRHWLHTNAKQSVLVNWIPRQKACPHATVEFHADKEGRHPYYCSLTPDDRCRHMHGEQVVLPPH